MLTDTYRNAKKTIATELFHLYNKECVPLSIILNKSPRGNQWNDIVVLQSEIQECSISRKNHGHSFLGWRRCDILV